LSKKEFLDKMLDQKESPVINAIYQIYRNIEKGKCCNSFESDFN